MKKEQFGDKEYSLNQLKKELSTIEKEDRSDPEKVSVKDVGITEEEQKAYLESRPYRAKKSFIHKGIMAKPGHTFLKVTVKWKDRKYTNVREFPTEGLTPGVMNHLYDKLYEGIKKHHQSKLGLEL